MPVFVAWTDGTGVYWHNAGIFNAAKEFACLPERQAGRLRLA